MSKRGSATSVDLRWRGVNERLLSGAVSGAFDLLDRLWTTALPEDLDRLLDLAKSSILIGAIHERLDPARGWLKRLAAALSSRRLCGSDRRKAELHLEAFEAFLPYYGQSRIDVGERFFERLFSRKRRRPEAKAWSLWLAWFYLTVLMARSRSSGVDAFLRRLPARAQASPLEKGLVLVQFGHRLAWTADLEASLRVLRSAERKLSGSPRSFLHEYFSASARLLRGWALTKFGDHEPATELLESVRRQALRWKIHRLHRNCSVILAKVHRGRGEFAKATEKLLEVVPRSNRSSSDSRDGSPLGGIHGEIEQNALVTAAWCAVRAHRLSLAERLLVRVENELGFDLDPTPLAWFHIVRGDLLTRHGIAGTTNLPARRAYEDAAEILREGRAQTENLRPFLLHGLAALACREKDFGRAVDYSLDLLACSPERPDRVSEGLLSQSLLLLHDPGNGNLRTHRERLYEGILSRLDVIRDPETLMRVVSRLYLYTWDETDDLELVDLHLKQLLSLRERLGEERFCELYRTQVSDPILQRMRRTLLGG